MSDGSPVTSWTPANIGDGETIEKSIWWDFADDTFAVTAEYFLCGDDGDSQYGDSLATFT